jgi:NH3-dependent NAD+ synthetase
MSKILSPDRVRQLMAAMQPKVEPEVTLKPSSKVHRAYEMIAKSKSTLRAASQSYGVGIKVIVAYAKDNGLPITWNADGLVEQARQLIKEGKYQNARHGLRTRITYELALKYGVSKACRMAGTTRRGLYYYCQRYDLPTPLRATGGMS